MPKKGYVTAGWVVKCYRVACEVLCRAETKKQERAEDMFKEKGWTYVPNRGWQCPNKQRKHR